MKILHVINSLNTGGAEKLVLDTVPLYNKKGITVDVLVFDGFEYPFYKELREKYCCRIISLKAKSVYNPFLIFQIIPYLKKYDIIHVHLFPAQYWVVLAKILTFSKVKLLFTEHSTTNRRLNNRVFKYLDRIIYWFYANVVCISSEIQRIINKHVFYSKDKTVLICNGVVTDNYIKAKPYLKTDLGFKEIKNTSKILIQVAGFREEKDQSTLIKAMPYLPENVCLFLVGDGPFKSKCEQLAVDLGVNKRIYFLGVRLDVPQLLKTADIVILSSKYEGLSLSSIEGMASGNPFVASNVPGLNTVVDGAGILFPLGDALKLANIINELVKNNVLYNATSKACIERAKRYDINIMVEKHIELYKNVYNN